jgi:Zn-dependent protease
VSERLGGPAQHHDPGTIRVGSLGGVDVLVRSSWFLIAALIAYLVAPAFEQVQPGLGSLKYVAGAAFAVLLTLSLLLHELSHALMSKRFGIPVRSITLHFIGGVTAMVATLLFLGSVEASGKGAYASLADDWAGMWIGGMIAIWLATAYRWNRRRRGTAEGRAGQETV